VTRENAVIRSLRSLVPRRALSPVEAVAFVELQAAKLLKAADITAPPVPIEAIATELLGIGVVCRERVPGAAIALSAGNGWLVALRAADPPTRRRFSCAHEIRHILDDEHIEWLYPSLPGWSSEARAEHICDLFAASVLMPRPWVKADWASRGMQDVSRLARRYEVSWSAMNYRLDQLGLQMPRLRCGYGRVGVAA
jgi:predicted transcriptional regulator